jgi:hypothetical protein
MLSRMECILRFELRRLLPLARGLERLMVRLGLHRDLARRLLRRGARTVGGTRATGGPVKADANDRMALLTLPRSLFGVSGSSHAKTYGKDLAMSLTDAISGISALC